MIQSVILRTRVLPGRRVEVETGAFFDEGEEVEVVVSSPLPGPPDGETPGERSRRFREWADSHEDVPELAPEAFRRDHFYGDRG
ncbi:MAG TPA: hypothetical protein VFJ58_01410 [Armatimonadota bacterium]|nr:hypothetical protein [Armatimonadota bacterium]